MTEFIEKNKRLLTVYCLMAQVLGYLLILAGLVWFGLIAAGPSSPLSTTPSDKGQVQIILYASSSLVFDFFFPGLITLGVAAFIRCLLQSEYKPGWILRSARPILYSYAAFLVGYAVFKYFMYIELMEEFNSALLLFAQPVLLPIAAKLLILIGLGQILKRVMPVIEESKTLV